MVLPLMLLAQGEPSYTTYGTFQEVLQGSGARYPALIRVSDPDAGGKPAYTGFFFYQCLQFDTSGRYLLAMKVYFQNRLVQPADRADIGVIDLKNQYKWTKIGESTAWNWQQGARLQWRPGREEIVWNDRSDDGKHYICRVYDFRTGKTRILPRPIYDLSPDGETALTHDFERMKHRGTDYVGIEDKYKDQIAPRETGVWKMNMNTGSVAAHHVSGKDGRDCLSSWPARFRRPLLLPRGMEPFGNTLCCLHQRPGEQSFRGLLDDGERYGRSLSLSQPEPSFLARRRSHNRLREAHTSRRRSTAKWVLSFQRRWQRKSSGDSVGSRLRWPQQLRSELPK